MCIQVPKQVELLATKKRGSLFILYGMTIESEHIFVAILCFLLIIIQKIWNSLGLHEVLNNHLV